jgi:hypothetical protein
MPEANALILSQNIRVDKLYFETTNLGVWISNLSKHEKKVVLLRSCVETSRGYVRRTYIEVLNSVYLHTFASTDSR